MKNIFAAILGITALLWSDQRAFTADFTNDLTTLVMKVQADIQAGKKTEADFADDLKQFDTLIAAHKGDQPDPSAQLLVMKAMLYVQLMDNLDKGKTLLTEAKTNYPNSKWGTEAGTLLTMLDAQAEASKVSDALKVGTKFPGFSETDVNGKPLSIANYKGKVVLIDFWATWCGPCVGELPNVLATYQKHHQDGFEIIGVSLDEDKDKLVQFTKAKGMTWQQFFDGKGWGNKLADKYGIHSIPATFLLDGEGNIIGENLRGEALEAAVAKALTK